MITKLTKEQESAVGVTFQEWLAIGRSTEALNREKAAAAIGDMYVAIGRKRPAVLFFSSPMMCLLAFVALKNLPQLWSQLGSQLESQLRSQLRSQLGSQLESQLWSQLGSQLGSQLESQLRSQLRSQLGSQLWSQLGSQLWNYFAGAQWCGWEVFYKFCQQIGVNYSEEQSSTLDLWLNQSRQCHWWWPYDGIVLASERPTRLAVDEQGRLHSLDGAAIAYSDGWGIHAAHGVRVAPYVIENPKAITAEDIESESNSEVRRIKMERYGNGRYLQDTQATELHRDNFGVLYRKPINNDEALVMCKVLNSTPESDGVLTRDGALLEFPVTTPVFHDGMMVRLCDAPAYLRFKSYFIRVPPNMERARQAIAWTFGKEEMAYDPYFQT